MPLFHFTLHTYRSWNADHPRGYYQRTVPGIQSPDPQRAKARAHLAQFAPFHFDLPDAQFVISQSHEVIARHQWLLFGITAIDTHIHLVVGWHDDQEAEDIQARLKRSFGYLLAQRHATRGRPYFSRGGPPEPVKTLVHLHYLLYKYFPDHHAPMWRKNIESTGW